MSVRYVCVVFDEEPHHYPLTMEAFMVALDVALEGDARAVRDWADRALQAGCASPGEHEEGCPWVVVPMGPVRGKG